MWLISAWEAWGSILLRRRKGRLATGGWPASRGSNGEMRCLGVHDQERHSLGSHHQASIAEREECREGIQWPKSIKVRTPGNEAVGRIMIVASSSRDELIHLHACHRGLTTETGRNQCFDTSAHVCSLSISVSITALNLGKEARSKACRRSARKCFEIKRVGGKEMTLPSINLRASRSYT